METIETKDSSLIIGKIKKRWSITCVLTVISVIVTVAACMPFDIYIIGQETVHYAGHPVVMAVVIAVILLAFLFASARIFMPVNDALYAECDPRRFLILHDALLKSKISDDDNCCVNTYLGKYEEALVYADKMVRSGRKRLGGLYYKAKCEYFLGNNDGLKQTVEAFDKEFSFVKNKKARIYLTDMQKTVHLFAALAENDTVKTAECRDIKPWNKFALHIGFWHYMQGAAAACLGEEKETINHLMYVRKNCSETVLAELADGILNSFRS